MNEMAIADRLSPEEPLIIMPPGVERPNTDCPNCGPHEQLLTNDPSITICAGCGHRFGDTNG